MLRAASLAALALLAAVASACGGSAAAGQADPATAAPADAPFYVEVVVRPDGQLRDDALDAAAAFAVQDATIPKPIVLARGNGKVVVAYGNDAAAQALAPSGKLEDAEIYGQATELLEDVEPGFLLSMPRLLSLVGSAGGTDPGWDRAKPYLEAYDVVAMGAEGSGGRAKVRIAAGLK